MNEKQVLRKQMRAALTDIDGTSFRAPVISDIPDFKRYKTLFAFLSHGREPDTEPILRTALTEGIVAGVPRVLGDTMAFYRIASADGPFITGAFGIRELPESASLLWSETGTIPVMLPAIILVPGLAFTCRGERLGRGGGYYDRFLASFLQEYKNRRDNILLVGLCHTRQIVPYVPVDDHDIKIDCLLTENGYIICS